MTVPVNDAADPDFDDTSSQIVAAALALFVATGYEATTVRAIAGELGVTTPALYYHFKNKEAILLAAVTPYFDAVEAMLATVPEGDSRLLLERYLEILYANQEIVRFLYRDLFASNHPLIRARSDEHLSHLRQRLLGRGGKDLLSRVRVAAALGALRRPVLWLDDDLAGVLDHIVEFALAVLQADTDAP